MLKIDQDLPYFGQYSSQPIIQNMMKLTNELNRKTLVGVLSGFQMPHGGIPWYRRSLTKGDSMTPPIKRKFFR